MERNFVECFTSNKFIYLKVKEKEIERNSVCDGGFERVVCHSWHTTESFFFNSRKIIQIRMCVSSGGEIVSAERLDLRRRDEIV